MNIDRIFIINLKHRIDRKNTIIKEMKKLDISNYEFFDAIRPAPDYIQNCNPNFLKKEGSSELKARLNRASISEDSYRIGSFGCLKSHYEVIKLALSRNYQTILILEDDTMFIQDFNKIYEYANQIHNNFDMLYLCGSHFGQRKIVSQNISRIKGTFGTLAYLISKSVMKFVIDHLLSYNKEVDSFYANVVQKEFNCYCTFPHITCQTSGYSDIIYKQVDEKGRIIRA